MRNTFKTLALSAALAALTACAATSLPPAPEPAETAELILGPGDRMPSGRDLGTRSAVVAPNAAAATAHPLATQTALDVMKAGGNAMDAAIAANAMLGLVEPTGNGIGGDLFAIVYDPRTRQLYGYNGSGRSPMGMTLADAQAAADTFRDGEGLPPFGSVPVTVPGTVDGWFALHQRFGRRSMASNLAPTVKYAREGAPIPEVIAFYWGRSEARFAAAAESGMLEEFKNAKRTYFSPTPVEGSLFRNPDLANTLERIGRNGRDEFYRGQTARTMDAYFKRIGGKMRYEDFAAHKGEWVEPLCVEYRDLVKLCELPPNTQGVAALQMLQMLQRFDLREMGYGSPDALMAQIEAKRLAFEYRARSYADPAYRDDHDPIGYIDPLRTNPLSAYISLERPLNSPSRAVDEIETSFVGTSEDCGNFMAKNNETEPDWIMITPGVRKCIDAKLSSGNALIEKHKNQADKKLEAGDTTYLTVTDSDGMMVSLIQSNYRGMGSGLVADGLGFMFQDRGELFSLDPDHPNVFEPNKRPFHTIIPAFAYKKDMPGCQVRAAPIEVACPYEPWLSFGLMGGGMQPQGHVQIILNLIDFDMGLQEAGDAARWEHRGGCEPTDDLNGDECEADVGTVHLESGIPVESREELERRGHTVVCCNANGGGYQAIMRDFETGAWIAATEMRKDGSADGY